MSDEKRELIARRFVRARFDVATAPCRVTVEAAMESCSDATLPRSQRRAICGHTGWLV